MSCICFVLSILYKDRLFVFCTCIFIVFAALYLCCISIVFVLKLQVAMRNDTSVASNRRLDDSWMTPHICWSPPALQLKMINLFGQISNETLLHDGVAKKWGSILICFVSIFNRGNGGELSQELGKCLKNSF